MAEVAGSQVVEEAKEAKTPRHLGLRRTILFGSLGILAAGGTFLGFKLGIGQANADRSTAAATAVQDKNCISLENHRAQLGLSPTVARLGSLTAAQQVDCGVAWVSGIGTTYGYAASSPQGSIIGSSIDVRLPSMTALQSDEASQHEQAANTSGTDEANEVILSGVGLILGVGAWFGGATLWARSEQRRLAAQPPVEAIAAA